MSNHRGSEPQQSDAIWDAKSVLSIVNPDRGTITCVGYAPSKGRRCQNPISQANRTAITAILTNLSSQYPSVRGMRTDLEEVAEMGLCRRYHQYQADDMVERWSGSIKRERRYLRNNGIDPPQRSQQPNRVESQSTTERSFRTPSSTANISRRHNGRSARSDPAPILITVHPTSALLQPAPTELVELADQIRSVLARHGDDIPANIRREIRRLCNAAERLPSPELSSNESRFSASSIGSAASSDSEGTSTSISSSGEMRSTSSEFTPSDSPSSISTSVSLSAVSESTHSDRSSSNRSRSLESLCHIRHVSRRPLAENCVICTDACDATRLATLVWCKAVCGQSLHRECFETWRQMCSESGRRLRCPIWYVPLVSFC
jgi:hypothetical protein